MGATKHIKMVLVDKGIKVGELAAMMDISQPALSVKLSHDTMSFKTTEEIADLLGCDVVLRDRETGKIY